MSIVDFFKRLRPLFSFFGPTRDSPSSVETSNAPVSDIYYIKELNEKIKIVKEQKANLKRASIDWYRLESHPTKVKRPNLYQPYKFGEIISLKRLKKVRLERAARELKRLEDEINLTLDNAESFVFQRNASDASKRLEEALAGILQYERDHSYVGKFSRSHVRQRYEKLHEQVGVLFSKLAEERLLKEAEKKEREEEQRRKQEEEQRRKQEEEQRRKQEEEQRRKQEEEQLYRKEKEREEAQQRGKKRLSQLHSRKDNWKEFKQILDENGIKSLYHFTDEKNIPSIKIHGGLFSWHYCEKHDIKIPCPGGDTLSRDLDKNYGLENYVRLSFCEKHPMAYKFEKKGHNIKLLEIDIEVALWKDTKFSDMNAAAKRHSHGDTVDDLKRVHFDAIKKEYCRRDDPDFYYHQAEVMVKTFVPLEYIKIL